MGVSVLLRLFISSNEICNTALLLPVDVSVSKIAGMFANSADPDQTPHSTASDQGLHCSTRPACPSTWDIYGNLVGFQWLFLHEFRITY